MSCLEYDLSQVISLLGLRILFINIAVISDINISRGRPISMFAKMIL